MVSCNYLHVNEFKTVFPTVGGKFYSTGAGIGRQGPENRRFYCRSVAKCTIWRYNFPEVRRMQTIDKQQFGAFVARLRKEKGWTQKELAERLCISDKAVSKWETGEYQT